MTNEERFAETLRQFQLVEQQEREKQARPAPDCLVQFDQRVGVPSGLRWVRTHRKPHPGTTAPQENAAEPQSPRVRAMVREPKNEG